MTGKPGPSQGFLPSWLNSVLACFEEHPPHTASWVLGFLLSENQSPSSRLGHPYPCPPLGSPVPHSPRSPGKSSALSLFPIPSPPARPDGTWRRLPASGPWWLTAACPVVPTLCCPIVPWGWCPEEEVAVTQNKTCAVPLTSLQNTCQQARAPKAGSHPPLLAEQGHCRGCGRPACGPLKTPSCLGKKFPGQAPMRPALNQSPPIPPCFSLSMCSYS
jgi:hypothetical protein